MTARIFMSIPLGVVLALPGLAMAQKLTKKTVDVQNIPLPIHSQTKPKPSTAAAPRLTLDAFVGVKQASIQKLIDQQITHLRSLIQLASPDDPQLPDYLFRLGELFAEKYRYHESRARSLDEEIFRAEHDDDARPAAPQRHDQKEQEQRAGQTMQRAIEQFMAAAKYPSYPRMDEVAFYYAECLWQTAALTGADASLWRETAEQYTRVVHRDPQGPYVKEAAYAAVLAWQNALYETNEDLHRPSGLRPPSKQPGRASAAGSAHLL